MYILRFFVFCFVAAVFYTFIYGVLQAENKPFIPPYSANSEKRVLDENPIRDRKLLTSTNNNPLVAGIIREHSLIAGSKIEIPSRSYIYLWLVDNLRVSAGLSHLFGKSYTVSPGDIYEYHGDDGDGLMIDFDRVYRDSVSTVFTGHGRMKFLLFPISGSFINFIEYTNTGPSTIIAQSCMYVRVNNPVTRFLTNVAFALSDVEEGIMEKMFTLDDTVFSIVTLMMEDSYLYLMLQYPDKPLPERASELSVIMQKTILRNTSRQNARELGELLERARGEIAQ